MTSGQVPRGFSQQQQQQKNRFILGYQNKLHNEKARERFSLTTDTIYFPFQIKT